MEQRTPLRRSTSLVGPLAIVLLSDCTSNSQPRLEALAERLAAPGSELSQGAMRLQKAGFTCHPGTGAYALTCFRMRGYALLATCVQRIDLSIDPVARSISRTDVPRPACAGM